MIFKSNFFHYVEKLNDLWNFEIIFFTKRPLTMQEKKIIEKLLIFYLKDRSKQNPKASN